MRNNYSSQFSPGWCGPGRDAGFHWVQVFQPIAFRMARIRPSKGPFPGDCLEAVGGCWGMRSAWSSQTSVGLSRLWGISIRGLEVLDSQNESWERSEGHFI